MSGSAERTAKIQALIREAINSHEADGKLPEIPDDVLAQFTVLFATKAYGFREVVLTCSAAWAVGIKFDPCDTDFYVCNPRPVYEQGIRPVLHDFEVPCGKSGPLNVAKNQQKLNEDWASGRRPESAAKAAVWLLRWAIDDLQMRNNALLSHLIAKLIEERGRLEKYEVAPPDSLTHGDCYRLVVSLMEQAPDSGNTPQTVASFLLQVLYDGTKIEVVGDGKACETNTTSKKPADISVIREGIPHLYEVTVKPIDSNRLSDSADAVLKYGDGANEVTWLCNLPDAIKPIEVKPGECVVFQGIRNEFVQFNYWINSVLELIGTVGRAKFIGLLSEYVKGPNISESVKMSWHELNDLIETKT